MYWMHYYSDPDQHIPGRDIAILWLFSAPGSIPCIHIAYIIYWSGSTYLSTLAGPGLSTFMVLLWWYTVPAGW
jgi:hypothetical protein